MLRRIEPERIICYNEPFPGMLGNIVFVDYNLSSWRYMNDDPYVPSKYAKYVCGVEPWPENCDVVRKTEYITSDNFYLKGKSFWMVSSSKSPQSINNTLIAH